MKATQVIKKPVITEKSMSQVGQNKYTFEVDKKANKQQIAQAVEDLFQVEVYQVRVLNRRGKIKKWRGKPTKGRAGLIRYAVVTINPDHKIKAFEDIGKEELKDETL